MKTQSNALLVHRLHKKITDMRSKLEVKQKLYNAALEADEPFENIRGLYAEMKSLRKLLKELEAQVIISNYLAQC